MSKRNGHSNHGPDPGQVTLENARFSIERLLEELESTKRKLESTRRDFEIEMNLKNNLYAFVLSHGMFKELEAYSKANRMESPDGHLKAIRCLAMGLPENTN
ncbi:MAG: hypothetical protein A2Y71_03025 [Bacteroidetes bacterium RBG_13_42_15]|nr:MAG: hypothetical protein A2Y71_03025 [Bacteroidetes bacterium RBG_13_42_15]